MSSEFRFPQRQLRAVELKAEPRSRRISNLTVLEFSLLGYIVRKPRFVPPIQPIAMIRTIRTWITPIELRPNLPAQCACGCRRAGMGAPRNAIQVGRENGRPKRGWEPRTRKRRSARALRPPRTVGAAYEVLQTGKGAVCVLWCRKDEEQGSGACGVVCAVSSNIVPTWRSCVAAGCGCVCERVRGCWRRCARICVLMPKQRRIATWMSRRTHAILYPRSGLMSDVRWSSNVR